MIGARGGAAAAHPRPPSPVPQRRRRMLAAVGAAAAVIAFGIGRAHAGSITLQWDPNTEPGVAGYRLHYGLASRQYTVHLDVNTETLWALTGLDETRRYYFAVTAYDASGNESGYSNEVSAYPRPDGPESISTPAAPQGPTSVVAGASYPYVASGAASNYHDALQYQFLWSDGTTSGWLPAGTTTTTKVWASVGVYTGVRVQARCAAHPSVVSAASPGITVTVAAGTLEQVTTPFLAPQAPAVGLAGAAYSFEAGGATSSNGHPVQYRFSWGDGTSSGWLPVGTTAASKSWNAPGSYSVSVEARCATHPAVLSARSPALTIIIEGTLTETITAVPSPTGVGNGTTWTAYSFRGGAATSSLGHQVLRRFHWGDNSTSDWTADAPARAFHSWATPGIYDVVVEQACALHPGVTAFSRPLRVTIEERNALRLSESFTKATRLARRWAKVSGRWRVNRRMLMSRSAAATGLIVSRRVRSFFAGSVEGRFMIPLAAAGDPNAGFLFSFESRSRYRYVAFFGDRVVVGQVGDTPSQEAGAAATAPRPTALGAWHAARIDLHPDGTVAVYLDGEDLPTVSHRFPDLLPGRVGFVTQRSRAVFDDFRVWDASVLTGGPPAGGPLQQAIRPAPGDTGKAR